MSILLPRHLASEGAAAGVSSAAPLSAFSDAYRLSAGKMEVPSESTPASLSTVI